MNKKTLVVSLIALGLLIFFLVYLAYVVDSRKITTQADIYSDASADELTELPAPDQSTINKIYSAIINIFR